MNKLSVTEIFIQLRLYHLKEDISIEPRYIGLSLKIKMLLLSLSNCGWAIYFNIAII